MGQQDVVLHGEANSLTLPWVVALIVIFLKNDGVHRKEFAASLYCVDSAGRS